jgi:mRNA interferase RelE/StbE
LRYAILQIKTVSYTTSATRQLRKLPAEIRERIIDKLRRYAESGAGDVKALSGQPGARLRIGDYRVIFVEAVDVISVRAVGHRSDIYE